MNLKAVKMSSDDNNIIIGVNNVDAYMRQQETMEKMKKDQITYARISALTGNYVCVYIVDVETGAYKEYGAGASYASMGLAKEGKDFFSFSRKEALKFVIPEERELFKKTFTKRHMMSMIKKEGLFMLNYHLILSGKPTNVGLKAACLEEGDGTKLVIGISNLDKQIKI